MKKISLTVVFIFTMLNAINAQELKYGFKFGLTNPRVSGLYGAIGHATKIGINIGGFVEVAVTDKFSWQPELLFSTQGANTKESGLTDKSKLNLNYLNIPIMGKYYIQNKLSVEFGPQIGFLVSANEIYPDMQVDNLYGPSETIEDSVKKFDFGLNLGGGYDLNEKLSVNLRYNFGLSNIFKDEYDEGITDTKNRVLSMSILYKL